MSPPPPPDRQRRRGTGGGAATPPTAPSSTTTRPPPSSADEFAHITVWAADLSFPVLDFNVYLTGYDVQSINLRDILINGVLSPRTASAGQDPSAREVDVPREGSATAPWGSPATS